MKAAPTIKSLRVGSLSLAVRQYADGRYGFDYSPPGESRVRVRLHTMEDAERRAREILGVAHGGKVERLAIDEAEYAEFLQWKANRKRPSMVAALVPAFLESKRAKGVAHPTLRDLTYTLQHFAAKFPGDISSLSRNEVESWMNGRNVGPRRWNNMLAAIIALHRYARRDGLLPVESLPVERIEKRKVTSCVQTYSPEELRKLLDAVGQTPEWLPFIVLGAFLGVRPEEICPDKRHVEAKPCLHWKNFLWSRNKLDIPSEVAKDRRRRFVPLNPTALAWLAPWRHASGPVVPLRLRSRVKQAWRASSGVEWKSDGLRHSYASYRLALTKDMPALCLEMGNSPAMIFRHYLDLKHEDDARRWFGIVPET